MSAGPAINYDALAAQQGGSAQIDYDALAAQYGGATQNAQADGRNALQREFDNLVTVTPEQEKGHSWLMNKAQEFGAGAIQGVAAPFVHPEQTLEGIGSMIAHPIDSAEGMAQSAWQHPAQTLGNIVGGAVLGDAAAEGANTINGVASRAAGRAALLGKTPEEAYENALRPSVTTSAAKRASAVQGGLENAIRVSKSGLVKISDRLDALNQEIADTINADPNRPISPGQNGFANFNAVRAKFANQVNPVSDLNAIDSAKDEFLNQFRAQPGGAVRNITASEAQAMKQGTYRALGSKAYGEVKGASIEAQKGLARDLKDEIATQFPEISNLNAQDSRLLDLEPLLEKQVNRMGKQGMFRLGTGAAAGTVRALGGSNKLAAVAAILKQTLDDPMVKSRLAIAVSKGAKIPYIQAAARVAAYSSALQSIASSPPAYSSDGSPIQSTNGQP